MRRVKSNSRGRKSKSPKDGQAALDNSLEVERSMHRIGINNGEFVVFKKTAPGLYHGYACEWKELDIYMQNTLKKAKWVTHKGKIRI